MPHEVKMPQLGMTQDSGVIVSWIKAAGEAVAKGDALFEVETDKATMEVEAAEKGYLAGIRAGEGDDVPVGDVIAVIVESEAEIVDHPSAPKAEATPDPEPEAEANEAPSPPEPSAQPAAAPVAEAPRSPQPVPPTSPRPAANGKILASPKAKRLALEQGVNLEALRAQGIAEPIHAADLSRARVGGQSLLTAEASGAALDALLDRSEGTDCSALFAAFAAGAWRALFEVRDVTVALRALDGSTAMIGDAENGAALTLVDLCDTRLTGYAPAGGNVTLTVARGRDGYVLTLSFSETALPMTVAAALLNDIAARIEDPIRQLL